MNYKQLFKKDLLGFCEVLDIKPYNDGNSAWIWVVKNDLMATLIDEDARKIEKVLGIEGDPINSSVGPPYHYWMFDIEDLL